ncbi:pleckstrin homology domain-containing family A member 7 isoform X4 [Polypterus senegalus]|uniref:pleckstrin homology domain-containing family A member 7 isoform X4 n=1 Tax=Polypterus senegalus TaxID=55291 RepID=UPI001965C728|nr:pleckstrin homology domain-containing family A member 7 isoform X4 [Polypterus senegalus]
MAETERPGSAMSQASSTGTISSVTLGSKTIDSKVHNFGKRKFSVRRDPNCPVVIRGWLFKQDSAKLKLWKRRWFVLSDYCLFYYRDSREETILGSIPLPSYNIQLCDSNECKNKKFAFKAQHAGMRTYFFSAETQEDMAGWVRALKLSANLDKEQTSLTKDYPSYQDFTQLEESCLSLDFAIPNTLRDNSAPLSGTELGNQTDTLKDSVIMNPSKEQMNKEESKSGKEKQTSQTQLGNDHATLQVSGHLNNGAGICKEYEQPSSLLSPSHQWDNNSIEETPPLQVQNLGLRPSTHLGSRPHTPVGRVDVKPQGDSGQTLSQPYTFVSLSPFPANMLSNQPQDQRHFSHKPPPCFMNPQHMSIPQHFIGKAVSSSTGCNSLPPLPPTRASPGQISRLSLTCNSSKLLASNSQFCHKKVQHQIRASECDANLLLTQLCGQDRIMQSLSFERTKLCTDKESLECALKIIHLQIQEQQNQEVDASRATSIEGLMFQQAMLQEELVQTHAKICDVTMEMDRAWEEYKHLESELYVLKSHLEHICMFGRPQEKADAHRQLWIIEDVLIELCTNKSNFHFAVDSHTQTLPSSILLHELIHHPGEPSRPPKKATLESQSSHAHKPALLQSRCPSIYDQRPGQPDLMYLVDPVLPVSPASICSSNWTHNVPVNKKEERLANPDSCQHSRIKTGFLPMVLTAHHVSLEEPCSLPEEIAAPHPDTISTSDSAHVCNKSQKVVTENMANIVTDGLTVLLPEQSPISIPTGTGTKCSVSYDVNKSKQHTLSGDKVDNGQIYEDKGPMLSLSYRQKISLPKTVIQPPFVNKVSDHKMTVDNLDAKQRRMERISNFHSKSTAMDNKTPCVQTPPETERDKEDPISLSYSLVSKASQLHQEITARSLMKNSQSESTGGYQDYFMKVPGHCDEQDNFRVSDFSCNASNSYANSKYCSSHQEATTCVNTGKAQDILGNQRMSFHRSDGPIYNSTESKDHMKDNMKMMVYQELRCKNSVKDRNIDSIDKSSRHRNDLQHQSQSLQEKEVTCHIMNFDDKAAGIRECHKNTSECTSSISPSKYCSKINSKHLKEEESKGKLSHPFRESEASKELTSPDSGFCEMDLSLCQDGRLMVLHTSL